MDQYLLTMILFNFFTDTETFASTQSGANENMQNVASIYNDDNMKITNLEVTGNIKVNNIKVNSIESMEDKINVKNKKLSK